MQEITNYIVENIHRPEGIALLAYVGVWLIAMLRCIGYKRIYWRVQKEKQTPCEAKSSVSVIVRADNQCERLKQLLPVLLDQRHPNFEIIVVDMNSKDDTMRMISDMQQSYPQLRVCQLPADMRDVSPESLALTLGVRAAEKEWVLFTHADCTPVTPYWLARMTAHCTEDKDIVLGYTRYTDVHGWTGLRYRFFRAWQQTLNLTHAWRYRAYRAADTNLCYRRSAFMEQRGFADSASLLEGATDILVNAHSTHKNTDVCLHPDAVMLEKCPNNSHYWSHDRVFFWETRRHLKHTFGYRLRYFLSVWHVRLFTLLTIAAAAICLWFQPIPYPFAIAVGVLWLLHGMWRSHCLHLTLHALGERSVYFMLPLLIHLIPWWDFKARWAHRFANKRRFRKRFV